MDDHLTGVQIAVGLVIVGSVAGGVLGSRYLGGGGRGDAQQLAKNLARSGLHRPTNLAPHPLPQAPLPQAPLAAAPSPVTAGGPAAPAPEPQPLSTPEARRAKEQQLSEARPVTWKPTPLR